MSAMTSGPRGPWSERLRGVSSKGGGGGSISLGRAGDEVTRDGDASDGCPRPRTRFFKRNVASPSANGGEGITATSPIVGVGGWAGKMVPPPFSRMLGRRAGRVEPSSTPTPYPGFPLDLSLVNAGMLGGRCNACAGNLPCMGDRRAGVDGVLSRKLGCEPLSPTKGEAGGVGRTRSDQLPEPGRNMPRKLGRRFFVAVNSLRGLRPPDAALRCVWNSSDGPLVVGGDDGGDAYFSTAWRLIGAGLLRAGLTLGALVGVALLGAFDFFRLRRNSLRPAKPVFFGCASAAAVFGDGYPGEGKMYVPSGDGVPSGPRGATSVLGGVGTGGGAIETGTAGIDMCLALRVVMLDAWRWSTDGTTDSLRSTGVLSMVRSTSNWRLDKSCRPVDARPNSGGGDARGGPLLAWNMSRDSPDAVVVVVAVVANEAMLAPDTWRSASLATRASSVASVTLLGLGSGLADAPSVPVDPTSMSTVAISHHCAYSFSSATKRRVSACVPLARM